MSFKNTHTHLTNAPVMTKGNILFNDAPVMSVYL